MTRPRTCKNCGEPMPANTRRTVCSLRCRAALGGKSRGNTKSKRVARCQRCVAGRMPLVGGMHLGGNGRRYPCGPQVQGGQPRQKDLVREDARDVHAQLEAAVRRECAPPWERHPEPWDNVRPRRAASVG